jgi:hypothetical protein
MEREGSGRRSSSSGWIRGAFCLLMIGAIASACSSGNRNAVIPPSQGVPLGVSRMNGPGLTSHNFQARGHRHRRHRMRPNVWPPPNTLCGNSCGNGTYCYLTNGGVVQPGWAPDYTCWIMPGDEVDFGVLQQEIGIGDVGFWCSQANWWPAMNHGGPNNGTMSYFIVPNITSPGSWLCNRTDFADVYMTRDQESGGWNESGGMSGAYTLCGTINCAYPTDATLLYLVVYPGPAPTPLPSPAPTSTGSAYPSPAPTDYLVIYDNHLQAIVSDGQTRPSVVGLQTSLTAEMMPGNQPTNAQWGYSNPAMALFQFLSSNQAYDTTPPPNPGPAENSIFYWTQGQSQSMVTAVATVNGQQYTAIALYNVEAPSPTQMNATFNQPEIIVANCSNSATGYGPWFNLGSCLLPFDQHAPGITSNYGATGPADFGGWYTSNQMINSGPSTIPASGGAADYTQTGGQFWDDACWYAAWDKNAVNQPPSYSGPAATVTFGPAYDDPGYNAAPSPTPTGWVQITSLTSNPEAFQDHFMFRPAVVQGGGLIPSIWVTIGQLFWSWGGNVKKGLTQWQDGVPAPYVSPGTGSASTWLPKWNNRFGQPVPPNLCIAPNPTTPPMYAVHLPRKKINRMRFTGPKVLQHVRGRRVVP